VIVLFVKEIELKCSDCYVCVLVKVKVKSAVGASITALKPCGLLYS
jgi:hypothetical protein